MSSSFIVLARLYVFAVCRWRCGIAAVGEDASDVYIPPPGWDMFRSCSFRLAHGKVMLKGWWG